MRMNRAWDSFWGALGFVRRNRRQRHRAAARRRSLNRRHRLDRLEDRVVLNADPIAMDDDYFVSPYVETSTAAYPANLSNDGDQDSDPFGVRFDANPNRDVTLNPGDSYSWTYTLADGRGGFDQARVQMSAAGTPTAPPFVYVESTGLREVSNGAFEVKVRLSHAAEPGQEVLVDWQLQSGSAQEGADYAGVWLSAFVTTEWIEAYDAGSWVEDGEYQMQYVENWVNNPIWIEEYYDENNELVPGYWEDNWVDEGSEQEVWVVTGEHWEENWVDGYWHETFHDAGFYTSGTLVFAAGETEQTLLVYSYGDGEGELEESFEVVLSNAYGAELASWSNGTVTILDNAAPIAVDDEYTIVLPAGVSEAEIDLGDYLPDLLNDVDYDGELPSLANHANPGLVNVVAGQTIEYSYTIADAGGATSVGTVRIHVEALVQANNAPTFTAGGHLVVSAEQGFVVVDWAKQVSAGDESEAAQNVWFEVSVDDPAEQLLFEELPAIERDGTLWFTTAGVAGTATVRVRLRDDGGTDGGGHDASAEYTFTITLAAPVGSGSGGSSSGSADLVVPTIGFDPASQTVSVAEDVASGKASFVITLSEAVDHEVAVAWHTVAGTGYAGVQFPSVGGVAVFAAGQTEYVVEVPIVDDQVDRGSASTFHVVLTGAVGGEIDADAVAQGTILDDDVSVSISDATATEAPADSLGNPQTLVFTVTLSEASDHDVTVSYSTVAGTADSGDFTSTSGTITFLAGETSKQIVVELVDDSDNAVDPNNSDFLIGEMTEHMKVVLTSTDPRVTVARPYGVGTIGDDDWQQYGVVDPGNLGYYTQWYGPENYMAGDVIDLDPNCEQLNGGIIQFVVPEFWNGNSFWVSYSEPLYGWAPASPAEPTAPTITLESLDTEPATEGGKARFRFTLSGASAGNPVTVYYTTRGLTAAADADFTSVTGQYTFYGDGTYDVEVDLTADALTEDNEEFQLVADVNGMPLTTALVAVGQVAQPKVKSVKFLTSAESSGTTGELVYDNTQIGVLNYRYFPDAQLFGTTVETEGRNVVRVRATVEGLKEGDRVYFQAYDVDDVSRADRGDEAAPQGNDNFGRFAFEVDPVTGELLGGHHTPGAPSGAGGFAGLMRGVGADGTAHVWHGYAGDPLTEVPLVSGIVRRDWISGEYYAEAELLVSFQPGDNFRVVAIPQPQGDDPNWDTDDGQLPQQIIDAFAALDFADSKAGAQPTTSGAAATGTLVVWRYLHMEIDQMSPTGGEALGDTAGGTIAENLGMMGSHGWRFAINVDVNSAAKFANNSLEGGYFRVGGENFKVLNSTADEAQPGRIVITVERMIGRHLTMPQFDVGTSVTLYEDDYTATVGVEAAPTTRLDMSVDLRTDATKYMQSSFRYDLNRFAEAFIMPKYDLPSSQSGTLEGRNHWSSEGEGSWESDDDVTLGGVTQAHNGTASQRSDVFWTSYLGIAYQYVESRDFDPDVALHQGVNPTGDEQHAGRSLLGLTSSASDTFRNSFLFAEGVWDSYASRSQLATFDIEATQIRSVDTLLARVAIQEIARQFYLSLTGQELPSVMSEDLHAVGDREFLFSGDQLALLRSELLRPGLAPTV
jgi:hypothetical protein